MLKIIEHVIHQQLKNISQKNKRLFSLRLYGSVSSSFKSLPLAFSLSVLKRTLTINKCCPLVLR